METPQLLSLARALIDIDSTTGREAAACDYLASWLRQAGYRVTEQPVGSGNRRNLLATLDPPAVMLSTHIDCVPPFFPSRVEGGLLRGRGSCDAKGILASQVTAAARLRAAGETRVGLLFVVGEEKGSDGALASGALSGTSRWIINGEPTDNRLAAATRGVLRLRLTARGRAAHSSHPELGESAIDRLMDALVALRGAELPEDPRLGRTFYTIGLIEGGVAPNVVSPSAQADLLFRTAGDVDRLRATVRAAAPQVEIEELLEVPPVTFDPVPGFETAVFPFTTDVPFLTPWGKTLLMGPGSVLAAHADDEHVAIAELERAVKLYVSLVKTLIDPHFSGINRTST